MPESAFDPDGTVMLLDNPQRNRKTEAAPPDCRLLALSVR